jgi:nitroimidazol reductase NimA-like FMN-containing flavoprotein (pyridoxamine 5'-phosphate oxidase superfamily)
MTTVRGDWSRAEMTAYLEDATVPIRLSCRTPGGGLWMLSLWYRYRDGRFEMATGVSADVVTYLEADDGVAFEVSTNDPPYRGVRGAGTASITPDEDKTVLRSLIERYLGDTDSELARGLLSDDREEVRIAVEPEKLYTWDFSDRMSDATETDQS